jgi:subtilisin family serine protease
MKKKFSNCLVIMVVAGIVLSLVGVALASQAKMEPMQRKIVVFKPGIDETTREALISKVGGEKIKDLKIIRAKAVWLTPQAEKNLAKQAEVLRVDDDIEVFALARPIRIEKVKSQPAEVLPWGIDQVDAELVWPSGNTADPIRVGIIDTGISNTHPDLLANIKDGVNTINPLKSWNDDNGHGSHVAGIIGAIDNEIGVIGIGPKIDLYAIKVLNASGSGYLSDVIEGIQWAINNGMQVINMSLGTTSDVQSFHDAVIAAKNAGIVVVAAAGNSGSSVTFPAAYPEAIAVSATDQSNAIASWSSRGPEVDLAAPGVDIYSTYKGTGYATLSGTSMAAPHVTGSVALVLNTPVGNYDANSNGKWDPDEVQKKLQDGAIDLGNPGFDNLYGWGLVNAYNAVQP